MKPGRVRPVIGVSQRVDLIASYGEKRDALDQEWTRLLSDAGLQIAPLPNDRIQAIGLADELHLDGVILTGGNDLVGLPGATTEAAERDEMEAAVIDWASARKVPLLAICRGLQMLVRHLGGSLSPIDGHIAKPHDISWVSGEVCIQELSSLGAVNSFHAFALNDLGPHLRPLAYTGERVEAVVGTGSAPQIGLMWHPERVAVSHDDRGHHIDWIRSFFGGPSPSPTQPTPNPHSPPQKK